MPRALEQGGGMAQPNTIIDIVSSRSIDSRDKTAYSFRNSRSGIESLTYGQLDETVRRLASFLHETAGTNRRAVLVYPPGLDFIISLFGCMAASVVPIPVYPLMGSKPERSLARIRHVAVDSECSLILTNSELLDGLVQQLDQMPPGSRCMATDQIPEDFHQNELTPPDPDQLALLQYTSGSTALPRGVQITHRNLMANSMAIRDAYRLNSETSVVSWLPPYHDMGLIGGIVQPLYTGFPVALMAPHSFLQSPIKWLEAISETRATTSPSPNFGYDLCIRKISSDSIGRLDLSHWKQAICGAERVSHSTLERFAKTFEPAGFRMDAFCPSYGLAEATLLVTASVGSRPLVRSFDRDALESGRVEPGSEEAAASRFLVGNGGPASGITVSIIAGDSSVTSADGRVGEVVVSGPSVSQGYWNKPELNQTSFNPAVESKGQYSLRTGDTGFFHEGQLFIAGRIKDLIILSGKNHFPEDIEMAVRACDEAFEGLPGAAFSVDADGQEILVVTQEIKRHSANAEGHVDELFRRIHSALFKDNVRADAIVLLRIGTIPRTSSGKVQRHQCRNHFLQNKLQVSGEWLSLRAQRARGNTSQV
jgi:acyl-CoA synthetase (AMP-forming)/AMP-acid ligase II